MDKFLSKLLKFYDISPEEYRKRSKKVSVDDLLHFANFNNLIETVDFINDEINQNKKILIYGDYDTDGILGTSILFYTLKLKNADVGFYIPSRKNDGYGLNIKNLELFKNLGYSTIICVDNGITLIDEVERAKELGIKIVIIDHHTKTDKLPDTPYIVHWDVSKFTDYNMSAGATAFYVSWALLGEINEYLLALGAITTLSDLMPLVENNILLVKLGLEVLNKRNFDQIHYLLPENCHNREITENELNVNVIPKINAIGRIINDNTLYGIVRYFTTDSGDLLKKRAFWINEVNNQRKEMTLDAFNLISTKEFNDNTICEIADVNEGIIGLLANNLLTKFHKTSFIFTYADDSKEVLKGSGRSRDHNLIQFLENNQDLLLTHGGHKNAVGLSLKSENFHLFKQKLNELQENVTESSSDEQYITISPSEVSLYNYNILRSFAPFGLENPKPHFKISEFSTNELKFSRDRKHIITPLALQSSLVYFNYDEDVLNIKSLDFYGTFEINYFRDSKNINFMTEKVNKN